MQARVSQLEREVQSLRGLVRDLGVRLARLELSEFELVPEASEASGVGYHSPPARGSANASPGQTGGDHPGRPAEQQGGAEGLRREVAISIGNFLRQALNGKPHGTSGRSRVTLQHRYYIVCLALAGHLYPAPLILTTFAAVRNLCVEGSECGDYVGNLRLFF